MQENKEKMLLSHKPLPGYRPAFYIILAVGVIYLASVFIRFLF